jgi:hypothetical protein
MSSPATERYVLDPAPDALALAQDLLNTRGVGAQPDLLADVASATAWLSQVGLSEAKLNAADLLHLLAFRTDLHHLITPEAAHAEPSDDVRSATHAEASGERAHGATRAAETEEEAHGATPTAEPSEAKAAGAGGAQSDTPLAAARSAAAELVLGRDGVVELRGGGRGAEYVISRVLAGVLAGQQVDTWRRLKACKNPRCRVVFYDRSRNNSGAWHSLKTCGNPANLRAFRARNKEVNG